MWRRGVEEVRKAGPRKIAVICILAAIAVVFAYGNNSTNDAASGQTLPQVQLTATPHLHAGALRP